MRPMLATEKMPTATIISTSVQARRVFGESLINIILDAVFGNVGGEAASVRDGSRGPGQSKRELAQVGAIAGAEGNAGRGGKRPVIGSPLRARWGLRIVIFRWQGARDEAGRVDLVPAIQAEGFHLFEEDLGRPLVLPRQLEGEDSVTEGTKDAAGHDAEDGDGHDDIHQGKALFRLLGTSNSHVFPGSMPIFWTSGPRI